MANSESVEYLNQARYFVGVEQYNDALEYINTPHILICGGLL